MQSIALRIVVLWGWRRYLVAFIAGLGSVLALPPYYFFPILFITIPVLIWLIDSIASDKGSWRNLCAAGLVGWTFGFGYFLGGLYWLGQAFLVQADVFAWMIPFAIILLPAGLGLFTAATCVLARMLWGPGFARILALAICWAGFEWLRGYVLTGFPWNAIGYGLSGSNALLQGLSVFGIYGLSFVVILMAGSPAVQSGEFTGDETRAKWWQWRGIGAAVFLLLILWAGGQYRLSTAQISYVDDVRLRIMQPNISQKEKWKPENRSRIFAGYLELSNRATSPQTMGINDVTHLIWPESAPPFLLEQDANARALLAALLPPGTRLITGALRQAPPKGNGSSTSPRIFNSVLVINSEGQTTATYDKFHLVPFGEYLPFEKTLKRFGLRKLVTAPASFAAGPGPKLLMLDNAPPALPLVCYEAIFPRYSSMQPRPGWLLSVTNDAWFGQSAGPWQHFEQARARSIEQGLALVRAANTGISAVIDPYGRVLKRLEINRRGVIDAQLPKALSPTLYALYGNFIFLAMLILSLIINGILRHRAVNM